LCIRYFSSKSTNNQYYASGSVNVINNATGAGVYHSTTVRLESGSTVLVTTGKIYGTGDVGGTTGNTPTAGTAKIYYAW
jgi:hypothetical protein